MSDERNIAQRITDAALEYEKRRRQFPGDALTNLLGEIIAAIAELDAVKADRGKL